MIVFNLSCEHGHLFEGWFACALTFGEQREVQRSALQALRAALESVEDVGDRFAQEVRRIHAREAPPRSIRGTTIAHEANTLREEGIDVVSIAVPDMFKKPMH